MQRLRISTAFSIDHQLRCCAFGAVDVEAGECVEEVLRHTQIISTWHLGSLTRMPFQLPT
jgi:hypothetical protein